MKKDVINLKNGVTLEVDANGFTVISATGVCTSFDKIGNPLPENDTKYPYLKHFFFMGENEREAVKRWAYKFVPETKRQNVFFRRVKEAISKINYDYWISTLEPSMDEKGNLYFEVYNEVATGLCFSEWKEKCKNFAPDHNSKLASMDELFMWYAYRIAMNYWDIEYVCDDSGSGGNFWNAPGASHIREVSGCREIGKFADGVGNTMKVVLLYPNAQCIYTLCGGDFSKDGYLYPVADVCGNCYEFSKEKPYEAVEFENATAVIVLKK